MPLDPSDERWIRERLGALDAQIGRLLADEQHTNRHFLDLHNRLKAIEKLNGALYGLVAGLLAGAGGAIYWGGSVATRVDHANEAHAAIKELAREFHEHERRTAGKAEPVK